VEINFSGGYMQNFDIEVEGHTVSSEVICTLLRQYMTSVGGQNFAVHVKEKFTSTNKQSTPKYVNDPMLDDFNRYVRNGGHPQAY